MQDFTTEWIDHTDRSIAYSAHNRVIHAAAFDQFADKHALVNKCDVEITRDEAAIGVLHLAWIGNDALESLRLEVFREQHKLAEARYFAPVKNSDTRCLVAIAPLLVGVNQRMQDAVARWQWANLVASQELAQHRAKRPPAEEESTPALLFFELLKGLTCQFVAQELVIALNSFS